MGDVPSLAFIGGTGPQGRGLAFRLAAAGYPCILGSRDASKAEAAVGKVHAKDATLDLRGAANDDACAASDIVFVVVPFGAQASTLETLADTIGDRIVVNCLSSLAFDDDGPYVARSAHGSWALECQQLLPEARVVGAFQSVSASKLLRAGESLEGDVALNSDDDAAKRTVAELVERMPDLRPVDAGPLRLAGPLEDLTAVLLAINSRYDTRAGVRFTGLDRAGGGGG